MSCTLYSVTLLGDDLCNVVAFNFEDSVRRVGEFSRVFRGAGVCEDASGDD